MNLVRHMSSREMMDVMDAAYIVATYLYDAPLDLVSTRIGICQGVGKKMVMLSPVTCASTVTGRRAPEAGR
jgi:hypothetical protein